MNRSKLDDRVGIAIIAALAATVICSMQITRPLTEKQYPPVTVAAEKPTDYGELVPEPLVAVRKSMAHLPPAIPDDLVPWETRNSIARVDLISWSKAEFYCILRVAPRQKRELMEEYANEIYHVLVQAKRKEDKKQKIRILFVVEDPKDRTKKYGLLFDPKD